MPYTWTVEARTPAGTLVAALPDAEVFDLERSLRSWGGCTVVIPTTSADLANVVTPDTATYNELWVYASNGGTPLLVDCFVPTNVDVGIDRATLNCAGVGWYLSRRYVGKADRANQISNGGFESGALGAWTASGVTATVETGAVLVGTYALKLDQASQFVDTYVWQNFTSPSNGVGVEWTASAWVYVDKAAWNGPAFARRGLFMQRGTGIASVFASDQITRDTPRGKWVRLETRIWVPPDTTETIQVRLYAPGGIVWWDEVNVVAQESISYPTKTSTATIASALVTHAQDTAYGKSDVEITGSSWSAFGATAARTYQFAEHQRISDALDELAALRPSGRWWVQCEHPNVRTVYTSSDDTATTYAAITSTDVLSARWSLDASQAANSVVVLGANSDGPDREEGAAVDGSAFGGLILEEVTSAPAGTTVDALDNLAAARLAEMVRPARLEVELASIGGNTPSQWFVDSASYPGDRVTVAHSIAGVFDVSGTYLTESMRLDPYRDVLALGLRWVEA